MKFITKNPYTHIHYNEELGMDIYRPILWVELFPFTAKGRSMIFPCILDTGADFNLLPASVCKVLGHSLRNSTSEPMLLTGIEGMISGHLHTNKIRFNGETATCDFLMCERWETEIGLLGHAGFFSKYSVLFNTSNKNYKIYKN